MLTPPNNVKQFYQARGEILNGDVYRVIGVGEEFDELPQHEDYTPVPDPVLAAYGFYVSNVLDRDNGSVYLFRANADGTPTFGVLSTSDGGDYSFEVYSGDGELFGAARLLGGIFLWRERDAVRRATWEDDRQELITALQERRNESSS